MTPQETIELARTVIPFRYAQTVCALYDGIHLPDDNHKAIATKALDITDATTRGTRQANTPTLAYLDGTSRAVMASHMEAAMAQQFRRPFIHHHGAQPWQPEWKIGIGTRGNTLVWVLPNPKDVLDLPPSQWTFIEMQVTP